VAFADGVSDGSVAAASSVLLTRAQTDFTVPLSIAKGEAYAGVEMAIQCGEGVTIESVDYSRTGSHAGPTEARGFVWFSAFSGKNEFTSGIIAEVHMNYSGEDNTSIVIDHAAFHTVDGGTFRTENVPLRKVVSIEREGASNPTPTLDPPNNTAPGSGNPSPGSAIGGAGGAGTETAKSASTGNTGGDAKPAKTKPSKQAKSTKTTKSTSPSKTTNSSNGTPAVSAPATVSVGAPAVPNNSPDGNSPSGSALVAAQPDVAADNGFDEQFPIGDDTSSISSSKVPLSEGNANTTTSGVDATAMNTVTLIMALACLAGVLFLGFLLIKRKRDDAKRKGNL
jgi:hypothetical protein